MSGRGKRRRRRRRGEQIKSCQMEILGFKLSETGEKDIAASSRRLCYANRDKFLTLFRPLVFFIGSRRRFPNRRRRHRG